MMKFGSSSISRAIQSSRSSRKKQGSVFPRSPIYSPRLSCGTTMTIRPGRKCSRISRKSSRTPGNGLDRHQDDRSSSRNSSKGYWKPHVEVIQMNQYSCSRKMLVACSRKSGYHQAHKAVQPWRSSVLIACLTIKRSQHHFTRIRAEMAARAALTCACLSITR